MLHSLWYVCILIGIIFLLKINSLKYCWVVISHYYFRMHHSFQNTLELNCFRYWYEAHTRLVSLRMVLNLLWFNNITRQVLTFTLCGKHRKRWRRTKSVFDINQSDMSLYSLYNYLQTVSSLARVTPWRQQSSTVFKLKLVNHTIVTAITIYRISDKKSIRHKIH